MDRSQFLVAFPQDEGELLHWWQVSDGKVVSRGCDIDPLFSAGLSNPAGEYERPLIVALIPSALVVMRRHDLDDALTEQQLLTVAIAEAKAQSLNSDRLHWAAATNIEHTDVVTASIGIDDFQKGLDQLQLLDIDPDITIPAACLIDLVADEIVQADFGFEMITKSSRWITADQSSLRDHLVGNQNVRDMTPDEVDTALANAAGHADVNLRSGLFAKKRGLSIKSGQRRFLTWLVVALIAVTIAIPVIQLVQYHWATDTADEKALASANTILDNISDLQIAERQLDEKMMAEGLGNGKFSVPASALFSALQQSSGVSVSRLSYDAKGILSAELSAIRNEDINPALLALQANGFVITATPRQDATGTAKADITVRIP